MHQHGQTQKRQQWQEQLHGRELRHPDPEPGGGEDGNPAAGDGAIGFGEWGRRPYLHWGLL